jgi:hypothetical protein
MRENIPLPADAHQNADLFWAIRGGGNFGIVTLEHGVGKRSIHRTLTPRGVSLHSFRGRTAATAQSSLSFGASRAPRGDSGIGREVPHPGFAAAARAALGPANDTSGVTPPVEGSAL